MPCRTLSGFEPGATLHFSAVMEYRQSGEVIDRCERVVARRSPGRFRPGCYLREPLRIPLPIVVSGTGEGVSSPVRVPSGRLIAQLSLSTGSAFVTAIYEDGSTEDIFWWQADGEQVTFFNDETQAVRFEVDCADDAAWTITISDAFPD